MDTREYINCQIKCIKWWSNHYNVSLDQASTDWIQTGLAEKFARKHQNLQPKFDYQSAYRQRQCNG